MCARARDRPLVYFGRELFADRPEAEEVLCVGVVVAMRRCCCLDSRVFLLDWRDDASGAIRAAAARSRRCSDPIMRPRSSAERRNVESLPRTVSRGSPVANLFRFAISSASCDDALLEGSKARATSPVVVGAFFYRISA